MLEGIIVTHKVNTETVQAAYLMLIDRLETESFTRAELIIAMMALFGTQYNGGVLPEKEMSRFTNELSQWLSAYFAKGGSN